MLMSHMYLYVVKEAALFWGLGQLMRVAHKRTRALVTKACL